MPNVIAKLISPHSRMGGGGASADLRRMTFHGDGQAANRLEEHFALCCHHFISGTHRGLDFGHCVLTTGLMPQEVSIPSYLVPPRKNGFGYGPGFLHFDVQIFHYWCAVVDGTLNDRKREDKVGKMDAVTEFSFYVAAPFRTQVALGANVS